MSSDESDEDFVPGEPVKVSEEESADDETDLQYEQELAHKAQKRKSLDKDKPTKKRKTKGEVKQIEQTPEEIEEQRKRDNPEDEKKHEEDLWSKFLEGTDALPKPKENTNNTTRSAETPQVKDKVETEKKDPKNDADDEKAKERKIFEFAGETIIVEDNIIKEKIKNTELPAAASKLEAVSTSRGRGGLSSVLGQINRKSKLSTLEKSKLDWETYKKEEGIEDEVKSDNKSKKGYLDRQDFLQRADLRQYEIERDLRMSRRSNR